MSIRRGARPADNFCLIANEFTRDRRLSFKARGIGLYLLSHADGFRSTTASIAKANDCGLDQVRGGLQELEKFGYLQRERNRDDGGHNTSTDYLVTDHPEVETLRGETLRRVDRRRETRAHKKTKGSEDQETQEDFEPEPSVEADASTGRDEHDTVTDDEQQDPFDEVSPSASEARVSTPDQQAPGSSSCGVGVGTQSSADDHHKRDLFGSDAPPSPAESQRQRSSAERNATNAALFGEFWDTYAHKVGIGDARKSWTKACKKADPREIINAAARYAASQRGTEKRFVAHAATWLNGERWLDEPEYVRNGQGSAGDRGGDGFKYRNPTDPAAYDEDPFKQAAAEQAARFAGGAR